MYKEAVILSIDIFICLQLSMCTDVPDRKYHAYNDISLDNLVFDDDDFLQERQGTNSLMECALYCKDFIDCVSFCYDDVQRVCRLHITGFYVNSDGIAEEGWKYYAYGDQSCPVDEGFVHARSSNLCIHLSPIKASYTAAQEYCNNKNSRVMSLDTSIKSDVVVPPLKKHDCGSVFVGLMKLNGYWTWENGNKLGSNSKWKSGQPYCPSGKCKCVAALRSWNWLWNDLECDGENNFFCEVEQE